MPRLNKCQINTLRTFFVSNIGFLIHNIGAIFINQTKKYLELLIILKNILFFGDSTDINVWYFYEIISTWFSVSDGTVLQNALVKNNNMYTFFLYEKQ